MNGNNNVKAVVFDMAGTTIDEGNIVYDSVKNALQLFGYSFTLEHISLSIGGMSKKEGIEQLVKAKYPEQYCAEMIDKIFYCFLEGVENRYKNDKKLKEMAGASELFNWLKNHDIKIALNTGYSRRTVDVLLRKMHWKQHGLVDYIVTSDEVQKGRPAPFMIEKISEEFVLNSEQIVKIGDTKADILEGLNAGCTKVIGITSSKYSKSDLLSMGATHAIENLIEVKEIINA